MKKTKRPDSLLTVPALLLVVVLPVFTAGQTIPPSPFWKNEITFPDDPFCVAGSSDNEPGWVKFTILLEPYDPNIVYFQDGHEYAFHYHFAAELLEPFIGMTPEQFNQVTLFADGRKAILGAVILPPRGGYPPPTEYPEYGIQFVGQDVYSKEEIVELFNIVKSSIAAGPEVQAFYFPTYEQKAAAMADQDWLDAHGVAISSPDRWAEGNTCYSQGWALGELKYVEGSYIDSAYYSGLLKPGDILITDGVPAEVPYLAGIISLSPSTPNSHVAILAQNSAIPFVYLAIAEDANRAMELVGRKVVLRAYGIGGSYDVRLIDIEGVLDDAVIEEILALKEPPPLEILPVAPFGSYSACTDDLLPSDIQYFGGKAANFGILRKAIPENSPVSVALSFDLWNEFLGQKLFGGRTLREEIDTRLEPYKQPPINPVALSSVLAGIRGLFTSTSVTSFTDTQKQAIIDILQDNQYEFDPIKKIRFRSSTNMEDSEQFTGAGLYDSYSGCLADDLDTDDTGPCRCDPTRSNERGVFRAIRRVFASFYNDNAFLERLRYDVNEHEVGMAILVHHSFPDEIELANGVAVVDRRHTASWDITLVTQKGATSVTNPADGSIPEEVNVLVYSFGVFPTLVRQSNLIPLGAKVMDWQDDYVKLSELLVKTGEQFGEVTGKDKFLLEMEYKKVAPDGKLVVKQVRQIPQPDKTPSVTPFLVNEPVEYCTFQGEFSDVFANHRLKSQWLFETDSLWLSKENLAESFYAEIDLEYVADARIRNLRGKPSMWPMSSHNYVDGTASDDWLMHHLSNQRSCRLLITGVPDLVSPAQCPILTLSDMGWMTLEVEYVEPVPFWDWDEGGKTIINKISLSPCPKPQTGDLLQERQFKGPDGISIETSFYWPPPPKGIGAGYTAPLIRWVETSIEGYTSEPIVLHGYYSQTYRPEHHNFDEHFLFEPQLEPEFSIDILAELRMRDVRMIHVFGGMSDTRIKTYGYDDKSFVIGDLSGDGNVDVADFALFAEHWLRAVCDTCDGADLTGDGEVGFNDLVELADNWLAGVE
jgi:hypothetical protein